jgi:hypothetical protein
VTGTADRRDGIKWSVLTRVGSAGPLFVLTRQPKPPAIVLN